MSTKGEEEEETRFREKKIARGTEGKRARKKNRQGEEQIVWKKKKKLAYGEKRRASDINKGENGKERDYSKSQEGDQVGGTKSR